MSQYEQENDLGGRAGGEVDEETMEQAWQTAAEQRSSADVGDHEAGTREATEQDELSSPD